MSSAKKAAANRDNAKSSTGPTTERGKSYSSRNSIKHGVLADELIIAEVDQPQFEALRAELETQLSPSTALQRIAFDRIMCSLWRQKLAVRLDAKKLTIAFDQLEENESPAQEEVPLEGTLQRKWYGESGTDLRAAFKLLSDLRKDIEANGWIHMVMSSSVMPSAKNCGQDRLKDLKPNDANFNNPRSVFREQLSQHRVGSEVHLLIADQLINWTGPTWPRFLFRRSCRAGASHASVAMKFGRPLSTTA